MSKLPDTWQEVKLKDIATFSQGLQVGVEEQVSTPIDNYVRFIRIIDYTQKNEDIRFVENKDRDILLLKVILLWFVMVLLDW